MKGCTVFVRETVSTRKHGADVTYLHLAHNVWDAKEKKAHTKILHSFGRKDQLDVAAVKRLVKSLAAYLPHEEQFELFGPELTFPWCRPFGAVYALDQLWKRFGLQQFFQRHLRERAFQIPVERALFAMVAQRALAPASKLSLVEQWIKEEVLIPGGSDLQVHHLYRALDFLALHLKEVEGALYHQLVDLFSLDVSLIFFDTTSVYFETDEDTDGLRRFGYSKDHRPDRPHIVVAVAINRDGYPLRHWVLPGNTADVTLTRQVAADLQALRPRRFVFVGDRGMVSQKNLDFLESRQLGSILGVRARSDPLAEAVLSTRGRFHPVTENLQVKEATVWKGARKLRYLLCYNPEEAKRDKARREDTLEALEAELASPLALEKGRAQLLASRRFGRYLTVTATGSFGSTGARCEKRPVLMGSTFSRPMSSLYRQPRWPPATGTST